MGAQLVGAIILWLIAIAVIVAIAVYILRWLYRRSTKETAFVRTGFGGERVVVNGGAFVIPVLHEVTPVNLNVARIEVRRGEHTALITRDRMRVDLIAEFFLRVKPTAEAVSLAAQTLGSRALQPAGIRDLFEGKFASALRTVAASMTLEEIHENRSQFMVRVREHASEALAQNGLEIESVALVDVDQTSLDFFDPSNAFDAEGLTQLTQSIETRRKMRNQIEQETLIAIRNQNLATEQRSLEIERESEYSRLDQEREIEVRRALQRSELVRERALREQEGEQAQLTASEATEKSRMAQARALAEERILNEEEIQRREIARRRAIEEVEIRSREESEREQIAFELAIERERIGRLRQQEEMEVDRRRAVEIAEREREIALAEKALAVIEAQYQRERASIVSKAEIEKETMTVQRRLDEARIERERALESLEIARRQAFEEAEIAAGEEVERARIATERGINEARVTRDRDLRRLEIDKDKALDIAEIERAVAVATKSLERSEALVAAEGARLEVVRAEEKVFTAREEEVAERRKAIELIATLRDSERERVRLTARAEAEQAAAGAFAAAEQTKAKSEADAERIRLEAAAVRMTVEAEGQRQANEADNVLSDAARAARSRHKLLDKLEGIVRESVKPMEKIEGINILHVDGMNGGNGGQRNVTDEVIDSALRYRVQAPMIDKLMKEVGIEGGSIGRMTDVLRDAKDIDSLTRGRDKAKVANGGGAHHDDDRDR